MGSRRLAFLIFVILGRAGSSDGPDWDLDLLVTTSVMALSVRNNVFIELINITRYVSRASLGQTSFSLL